MYENVTAIIPAYNEGENIAATVDAIKKIEGVNEIIVVDDGSKDNTYEAAQSLNNIILIHNKMNKGKGGAIQAALSHVSNEYVILVDADLRHSAIEMKKLLSLERNANTMVVATYPKALKKGGFGFVKGLSRNGLYILTSKTSGSVLSGQRLINTDFLKSISIPNNFGIEFKITLEALRNNINIVEIPVNIRHRETGRNIKGFVHRGKQFIDILNVMIREMI